MDLHRVKNHADWEQLAKSEYNLWQHVAASTRGVLTPGNVLSLLGLLSVPVGLVMILGREAYVAGLLVLLIGRGFDVLDGMVAQATHTKSPFGEKVDAIFDKISTAVTLLALTFAAIIPLPAVIILLLPHMIIAVLAVLVYLKGKVLHPSLVGKLSMVPAWFSLIGFIAMQASTGWLAPVLTGITYALLAVSVVLSSMAVRGYTHDFYDLIRQGVR